MLVDDDGVRGEGLASLHTIRELHSANGRLGEFEVGVGYAPAHHGELLQGKFYDDAGRLHRALVTLPQPGRGSRALFYPSQRHWGVVGTPELTKVRRAISTGCARAAGVTATIRAVADFHGVSLSREEVGRLAVLAECASDSIMIDDRVVLFAHREGVVLETLGPRLPPMIVVGCDTEPGARVDTLALQPAEYNDEEIGAFQVLRAGLRRAIATQDVALVGRVATASARINQRFLPKPMLEPLLDLCLRCHGCGIQVAHSGTLAGLILDTRRPGVEESVQQCISQVQALGIEVTTMIRDQHAAAGAPAADIEVPA